MRKRRRRRRKEKEGRREEKEEGREGGRGGGEGKKMREKMMNESQGGDGVHSVVSNKAQTTNLENKIGSFVKEKV